MPPKKEEEEEKPLLGRPGNHVKMGIVGLPNVGKSSFFNLMCRMNVPAENRPFCTIDPNLARVPVPVAFAACAHSRAHMVFGLMAHTPPRFLDSLTMTPCAGRSI